MQQARPTALRPLCLLDSTYQEFFTPNIPLNLDIWLAFKSNLQNQPGPFFFIQATFALLLNNF